MRQWSSFIHLFLQAEQRLRAVADLDEGTVTLWVGQEPVVTIHTDSRAYSRDLAASINIAAEDADDAPPPPGKGPVALMLRLVRGGRA